MQRRGGDTTWGGKTIIRPHYSRYIPIPIANITKKVLYTPTQHKHVRRDIMVQVNYEKFLLYKMLGVFSPIFFVFFLLYKKKNSFSPFSLYFLTIGNLHCRFLRETLISFNFCLAFFPGRVLSLSIMTVFIWNLFCWEEKST